MSICKRRLTCGTLVIVLFLTGWLCCTEARTLAATEPAPDLAIESCAISPESPSICDTVTFSVTVKNRGDTFADASLLACTIDDTNLVTITVEPLQPGAVTIKTFTWKAPGGPHIFRAVTDSDGKIAESIEDNNDKTLAFSVFAPDLAIDAISWTPVNPAIGDNVIFTIKVINIGDKWAGVSHLDFSIDGSSRGYTGILGMEGGASLNVTYLWKAAPGTHKLKATADILNQVVEGNKDNNTSEATCATLEPDLIISSITTSPNDISENTTVTFSVNIKNQGGSRAGPSSVVFYMDDSVQGFVLLGSLESGAVTTANYTCIAGNKPRTFKAAADIENRVKESDETNNTRSMVFPNILPDLVIQDITWTPSSPIILENISFSVTIRNQGKATAGITELKFLIDNAFLFTAMIPEVPPGATTTAIFNWQTQNFTNSIKASIDDANSVKESNETNNTMTKTVTSHVFTPSTDLIVEKLTYSPAKPVIDESVTVTLGVKNQGAGKASPSYAAIYIDGKLMDETYIDELNAGAAMTRDVNIPLKGIVSKETHLIVVSADCHNTVVETNELNNDKQISFSIFGPDLIIQTIRWSPEVPAAGNKVNFEVTVKNQGGLKAGSSYVSYYVDKVFMGKHRIEDIEPGTTVTRVFTYAAQKNAFLFTAIIDEANEINETVESNNYRTVALPAPDLTIDSLIWSPDNPIENEPVTFTASIKNRGFARSASTILSCYFDAAISISLETGEISPGETAKVVFTYSFVPGTHTLRLIADANDAISESDEANNEKTVNVTVQKPVIVVPLASSNSSIQSTVKTTVPATTATVNTSPNATLPIKTPTTTPNIAANISSPPPKWQSIIQNKLFIIGFGAGGVGAIGILLFLRKKTKKTS
jgi:subtilase family serine protease